MKYIDTILNKITMYRVVLYYVIFLLLVASGLGAIGVIPYSAFAILCSTLFIMCVSVAANWLFAKVYKVQTNAESVYITAGILALIISPLKSFHDTAFFELAIWASIFAMASKYIFAIRKKHIFNPAAIGVAIPALAIGVSASWWVGTSSMLPFVLFGGLLMVRKLRRADLMWAFFISAFTTLFLFRGTHGISGALFEAPILYFAFVMLTEPLTTPPTKGLRIVYGTIAGILFAPFIHIGSVYSTPELVLLVANIFSYSVSPKEKFILMLREKKKVANDTYDFWFDVPKNTTQSTQSVFVPPFPPGQYMEWTLRTGTISPDSRGNRRYFTIASSPTEPGVSIGVKFYDQSSTFKKALMAMKPGDPIVAGQRAGDFTLPKNKNTKLAFIAGGIGVTPFRSMIKYLSDTNEKRDITLFYSNKTAGDIAYKEIFDEAEKKIGLKIIYATTDTAGIITSDFIQKTIPTPTDHVFYISGPHGMVTSFQKTLSDLGVAESHIKVDFFPGFA